MTNSFYGIVIQLPHSNDVTTKAKESRRITRRALTTTYDGGLEGVLIGITRVIAPASHMSLTPPQHENNMRSVSHPRGPTTTPYDYNWDTNVRWPPQTIDGNLQCSILKQIPAAIYRGMPSNTGPPKARLIIPKRSKIEKGEPHRPAGSG